MSRTMKVVERHLNAFRLLVMDNIEEGEEPARLILKRIVGSSPSYDKMTRVRDDSLKEHVKALGITDAPEIGIEDLGEQIRAAGNLGPDSPVCRDCGRFGFAPRDLNGRHVFQEAGTVCTHCNGLLEKVALPKQTISWLTGKPVPDGVVRDTVTLPGTWLPLTQAEVSVYLKEEIGMGGSKDVALACEKAGVEPLELAAFLYHNREYPQISTPVLALRALAVPLDFGLSKGQLAVAAEKSKGVLDVLRTIGLPSKVDPQFSQRVETDKIGGQREYEEKQGGHTTINITGQAAGVVIGAGRSVHIGGSVHQSTIITGDGNTGGSRTSPKGPVLAYEILKTRLETQFEDIVFKSGANRSMLSSSGPLINRASELIRYVKNGGCSEWKFRLALADNHRMNFRELNEALLGCCRGYMDLKMLFHDWIGGNLDQHVNSNDNLTNQVLQLCEWAQRTGKLLELQAASYVIN